MVTRMLAALLFLGLLASCDGGSPLESPSDPDSGSGGGGTGGNTGGGSGGGTAVPQPIGSNGQPLPGTSNLSPRRGLVRREVRDAATGAGWANDFQYDAATDTFIVDGLAFDGSQPNGVPYSRSDPDGIAASGGSRFALYEAPATLIDPINNRPITQDEHRALYGVSASGETEFAIVRSGEFSDYGFGGFIFQRNGGVTLPQQGQATYSGSYGGIRDFDGRAGLEYVTGDMTADIDFRGFRNNCNGTVCADAVRGYVFDRAVYDSDGNNITNNILAAQQISALPTIEFRLGPNEMTENGEFFGAAASTYVDANGDVQVFESGNVYAIMSGDHTAAPGGEIVGMMVVTSSDLRYQGVTARETGGFILNR